MHKLLLMSVLLFAALVPAYFARDPKPKRGLKRTVAGVLVFNLAYLVAVITIYRRICWD